MPDTVVMGSDALSGVLEPTRKSAAQMNQLHIIAGGISPTAPQGIGTAQFIGTLYQTLREACTDTASRTKTNRVTH